MKVIVPFSYYYPEQCAGLSIIDDVLHACAEGGIESLLYVPTPTRNVSKDAHWEKDELLEKGMMHIHRFGMYGEGKNPLLRALRYVFTECAYLHALLWKDYDVIFLDSTPPIQGLKLPLVKLFRKKPVVHNAQDIFPDSLVGAGLAKKGGLLWHIGSWISKITYKYSDKIIVISEDFKKNIMAKGVPEKKIEVIYNWVDGETVFPVADNENELLHELGISKDRFTVVYAGNLGLAQNIDIIIDAAVRLPDIQFIIFGTGGKEDALRNKIRQLNLTNVRMFPLQSKERISEVYSIGDACVVSCNPGLGGSAMPSKTWTIMSCGRPVVANFDEGDLKNILESNACGVFSTAGDTEAFVATIKCLAEAPEVCRRMGNNARKCILENFTKEVGTQKYVDVIKSVVKSK